MKTRQELFTQIETHLINQNERSHDSTLRFCRYRDSNGRKCAIGAAIDDEHYSEEFEGIELGTDIHEFEGDESKRLALIAALEKSGVNSADFGMLARLQKVHDNHAIDSWSEKLREVALDYRVVPRLQS